MSLIEGLVGLTQRQSFQRLVVILAIGVVPIVMMWHVLFIDQSVHLANPGTLPFASAVTDLDGAARFAYLLSDMTFPWSNTTFISSPTGASIWRLETFSQLLQTLFLWLSVKIVPPMLAANLLIFLGWYGTGVVVYLIYRRCGGSKWIALACVFAVQLLPSMRFMAANFTSYVAVGIPLLVVLATVIYFQSRTTQNLLLILVSLLINGLYDPYWFMFSAFGVTIVIFTLSITRAISQKSTPAFGVSIGVVALYSIIFQGFSSYVTSRTTSGNSREITSGDVSWIRSSLLSVDKWSESVHMGVGLVALGLGILALLIFFVFRRKLTNELLILIFAASYIVLSTSISLPLNFGTVELAVNIRNLMPGVRFFDRAALIAGPLFFIFLFLVIEKTLNVSKFNSKIRQSLLGALVALLPLSFPGISVANTSNSYNDWQEIREELNEVPNPRLLALPFNRWGRDWIEQASFHVPLVNDLYSERNDIDALRHLSNGSDIFAAYLKSYGITHLLIVPKIFDAAVAYSLSEPNFRFVSSIYLNGYGEVPDFFADLYQVTDSPEPSVCKECKFGKELNVQTRVSGPNVHPPDVLSNGEMIWWITGGITKIDFWTLGKSLRFETPAKLQIDLAPCASYAEVEINNGNSVTTKVLNGQERSQTISTSMSQASYISIQATGDTCRVENDPRDLLIQLSNVVFDK